MRVLFDVCNIAFRAFNTHLAELDNGILFGTIRQLMSIEKMLAARHEYIECFYCFDGKQPFRRQLNERYKANRAIARAEHKSPHELSSLFTQISQTREALRLLELQVLHADYVEADDFICRLAFNTCEDVIIVSNDKDFYQLLSNRVKQLVHMPSAVGLYMYTVADLFVDYGCEPEDWAKVRALSGDASDNVQGVDGVGIKTAVKFIDGVLKPKHKTWQAITEFIDSGEFDKNLLLVELPLQHQPCVDVLDELCSTSHWPALTRHAPHLAGVQDKLWNDMCMSYSLRSLVRGSEPPESTVERIEL